MTNPFALSDYIETLVRLSLPFKSACRGFICSACRNFWIFLTRIGISETLPVRISGLIQGHITMLQQTQAENIIALPDGVTIQRSCPSFPNDSDTHHNNSKN